MCGIDELDSINQRVDKSIEKNDYDKFLDFEDFIRNKESELDVNESLIKDLQSMFKDGSIDKEIITQSGVRKSLKKLSSALKGLVESYENILNYIKENELVKFIESISPSFVMRLDSIVEDYEDIAENIDLGLDFTNDLSEVDSLAEKYSEQAKTVSTEKWVKEG